MAEPNDPLRNAKRSRQFFEARHIRGWSVPGDDQVSPRVPALKLCECAQQSLNVFLWVKAGEEKQPLAAFETGEVTKLTRDGHSFDAVWSPTEKK